MALLARLQQRMRERYFGNCLCIKLSNVKYQKWVRLPKNRNKSIGVDFANVEV